MRVIVFFDLPVKLKKDRKAYSDFRRFLIKDGYDMVQYSVYCRVTQNHDDAEKHIARLNGHLPKKGAVRVLTVTEKQYSSIKILVGTKSESENYLVPEDLLEV